MFSRAFATKIISGSAAGSPGPVARRVLAASRLMLHNPAAWSIILAAAIWVIGENFGGILTGQATDPNTGPLLVLVALAFWPLRIAPRAADSVTP